MKKHRFWLALGAIVLAFSCPAEAQQQPKKVPQIGVLAPCVRHQIASIA